MKKSQAIHDLDIARQKIEAYCAYQERCQSEVREKLYSWGLIPLAVDTLICELIEKNFLNEQRFAASFARGKFRVKHWGRKKIKYHLKMKGVSEPCILEALAEIDEENYQETLAKEAQKYFQKAKGKSSFDRKGKTAQYLGNKGFESSLIWEVLNALDEE